MLEPVVYDSLAHYVQQTPTEKMAKIAALQQVVDALDDALLIIATKGAIKEFSLSDGMTIIRGTYNSAVEIARVQQALQQRINKLVNQLNGRSMVIVDGKNLNGRNYGY